MQKQLKKVNNLTLERLAQFLCYHIDIIAHTIYGDAVVYGLKSKIYHSMSK